MIIFIKKYFFAIFLLLFGKAVAAISIQPMEVNVTELNANDFGIEILIDSDTATCNSTNNLYINYPKYYKEGEFKSINISIQKDSKLMLDFSLANIELDEFMGFKPFHGSTMCIDSSLLKDARIFIAYGKGEISTSLFIINSLDEWKKLNKE